jgi:hypothetical protein
MRGRKQPAVEPFAEQARRLIEQYTRPAVAKKAEEPDVKVRAQAIVDKHMRLAENLSDPVEAKRHLDAAWAAQRFIDGGEKTIGGHSVTVVVNEADSSDADGPVLSESSADESPAGVH